MINKKELKEQFKQMKPDMGIFMFKCKPTEKVYLGYGQNIKGDINSIIFQLNLGNFSANKNLQIDWKTYGLENFETTILEVLKYDNDLTKTNYSKDLQALRELVAEKFINSEFIGA